MLRSSSLTPCFLAVVMMLIVLNPVYSQGFLRDGFSGSMSNDVKGQMKLDEESTAGLSRAMILVQKVDWEVHPPVDFSKIKDRKLRNHLKQFFQSPVTLRLTKRLGKYGFRASGHLASGRRLRAFWREAAGGNRLPASKLLDMSYDEAVAARLPIVEFEIQLPPIAKGSKQLPSVVFSVPVEPGSVNPKSIVPRGGGAVKVLPVGRIEGGKTQSIQAGRAHVSLPIKSGIVDPSWGRGRQIFRKGRPAGLV